MSGEKRLKQQCEQCGLKYHKRKTQFCAQCGNKIPPRKKIEIDWGLITGWVLLVIVIILVVIGLSSIQMDEYNYLPQKWKTVYSAIELIGTDEGKYQVFVEMDLSDMSPLNARNVKAIVSLFGTNEHRRQVLRVLMK